MKIQTIAITLLVLLPVFFQAACGGNTSDNNNADTNTSAKVQNTPSNDAAPSTVQNDTNRENRAQPSVKAPKGGWFKSAKLKPERTAYGIEMSVETETTEPLKDEDYLTYAFWKNSERISEKREAILAGAPYQRGDSVFAEVFYHRDERVLARTVTNEVMIDNLPPVMHNIMLPKVRGPGSYEFIVDAEDGDGDQLAFSLLPAVEGQPLPEGLSIDEASGTVTYVLGKKAPPAKLEFTIAADDGNGGVVKRTVSMTFKAEKPKKPANQKEDGTSTETNEKNNEENKEENNGEY
jgi:hypothetical protein